MVAGAVIGQVLHAATSHHREEQTAPVINYPGDSYYLSTLDGQCLWIEVDSEGRQRRTQVDPHFCDSSKD
jgi:hypothetical protein